MKLRILLLLFTVSSSIYAQEKFLDITYDKVVMYEYDGGKGGDMSIVDPNGNFATTLSAQVTLDSATIKELNKRLTDKKSFGGGEAACYEPRLAFVYFLKEKIVAKVDICLHCNRLYSSLNLEAKKQGKHISEGETYYMLAGMSNDFKQWMNELIKSKGFKFVSN